jgi:hypothetical protein
MTLAEFYDIPAEYIANTMSVKNGFIAYLYMQVNEHLSHGVIPTLDIGTLISKLNSDSAGNTQDMFSLPSFFEGAKYNLGSELIAYRANQYGIDLKDLGRSGRNSLLVDYLLKTCICYVEIYKGNTPTKMYATRNMNIMYYLATLDADNPEYAGVRMQLTKGANDITVMLDKTKANTRPLTISEIQDGKIPFVKIEQKKTGYSITIPRNPMNIADENIRIVPVFFNFALIDTLVTKLRENIMSITYLKDNMIERQLYTTLNNALLTKIYEGDTVRAGEVYANSNNRHINRGYITVPDLLLPKYDETGCRAVNLRVLKFEPVDAETFKNPYLNVDLEGVSVVFEHFIDQYKNNIDVLRMLQQLIDTKFGELRGVTDEAEINAYMGKLGTMTNADIVHNLSTWIEMQSIIDKTQVSRALHTLLIENPMLFPRYTGERTVSAAMDDAHFFRELNG